MIGWLINMEDLMEREFVRYTKIFEENMPHWKNSKLFDFESNPDHRSFDLRSAD
jgi:hypothetical protein